MEVCFKNSYNKIIKFLIETFNLNVDTFPHKVKAVEYIIINDNVDMLEYMCKKVPMYEIIFDSDCIGDFLAPHYMIMITAYDSVNIMKWLLNNPRDYYGDGNNYDWLNGIDNLTSIICYYNSYKIAKLINNYQPISWTSFNMLCENNAINLLKLLKENNAIPLQYITFCRNTVNLICKYDSIDILIWLIKNSNYGNYNDKIKLDAIKHNSSKILNYLS